MNFNSYQAKCTYYYEHNFEYFIKNKILFINCIVLFSSSNPQLDYFY